MQPQIELQFYWRRQDIKEAIYAVTKAVAAGYDTKDKLLAVLPQFSTYRIALAIDALITADMAKIISARLRSIQTWILSLSYSKESLCSH